MNRPTTSIRLLRVLSAAVLPALALLFVLIARAGISLYGAVLVCALLGMWVGAFTLGRRRRRGMTRASLALFIVAVVVRGVAVQGTVTSSASADDPIVVEGVRVRDGIMARTWTSAVVDERDPAVLASAFLELMGALPAVDRADVAATLSDGYARLAADVGFVPSIMPTSILEHDGDDFDMITIDVPAPKGVVVFLHGSGGPFTLPCWQVAQAARRVSMSTWCPGTSPKADWATAPSANIAVRAVALARAQVPGGVVVAVGLSAGGIGVTALGDRLAVDGAIAISGTAEGARPATHTTVLIHGTVDGMASINDARALAAVDDDLSLGGPLRGHAVLEEVEGNHFILLRQHRAVVALITAHLKALVPSPTHGDSAP